MKLEGFGLFVDDMATTTEPWGQRTCYIADPEGNLVEIGSFVKE